MESTTFQTSNFHLATYLAAIGHTLTAVTQAEANPTRAVFHFPRTAKLATDVLDFEGGNALVDPRRFKSVENDLRDQMYDALRGNGGRR